LKTKHSKLLKVLQLPKNQLTTLETTKIN